MNEDFENEIDGAPVEGDGEEQQQDGNADLTARLAKIEAENAALRRQMTQAALAQPARQEPIQDPVLNLKGLPDPREDRETYETQLAQRIDQHVRARQDADRQRQTAVQQHEQRDQGIVQRFQEAYPDIAADPERMRIAAEQAWNKGKQRGIDMDRYVNVATEDFFSEVVAEHTRLFGAVKADIKADTEEGSRTGGLFGGLEGVGRPTGGKGGKNSEQLGSLVGDLKAFQKTAGLSW